MSEYFLLLSAHCQSKVISGGNEHVIDEMNDAIGCSDICLGNVGVGVDTNSS